MSAFIVDNRHIAYLIAAGLRRNQNGPLCWLVPLPVPAEAYQRGEPWGPESVPYRQMARRELTRDTADAVGHMLLAENFNSVNHRYAEEGEPETFFEYIEPRVTADGFAPAQVLKAIHCLEYQSCEHPEWEQSEAHAFLKALEARIIRTIPGYEAAAWGPPPTPEEEERRARAIANEAVARMAAAAKEEENRLERKRAVARQYRKERKERKNREVNPE